MKSVLSTRLPVVLALSVGMVCLLPSMSVSAENLQGLDQRINTLENEVETLNRAVYKGGVSGVPSASEDSLDKLPIRK